jgi:L-cysteine/cystine lyase
MPEAEKVAALREALPATRAGIYLNAGSCGPMPAETARAMDEAAARELAVGRAAPGDWRDALARMDEARFGVAAVLVADPADIALTHSTTDGLNLAISALPWQAGDRVLTTAHEHPAALAPLAALHARLGVEIDVVDFGDGGDGGDPDAVTTAFVRALERPARAIVVSHVLWTTGVVLPVGRLGAIAREAGAVSIIDGAQAAGAIPVQLDELGVDAYAVPAQKWLLGPEGMGALWVRRSFADGVVPATAGSLSYPAFSLAAPALHDGARRFEATGFHRPSVIGFARSLGWLSMYVGLPWTQARANGLAVELADRLAGIPGVTVLTPRPAPATLVTFRIAGWPAPQVLAELGPRTFAVVRDIPPLDAVRLSVGFWNTEAELDRVASAVETLAAHTPESIPPRRLAVLDGEGRPLA